MAIRKFRSKMKIITIIIALGFAVSSVIGVYFQWGSQISNKNYAFKVNGEKVNSINIARNKNLLSMNLQNRGDDKIVEVLAVNKTIEDELIDQMADKLKIKISSSEIKKEYKGIENQFKNKEQFKRMLQGQGYTKASFKQALGKSLRRAKLAEYFNKNAKVSDEELLKIYNENKYTMFSGESFESVKENLKQTLVQTQGSADFSKELYAMKKEMKLEDIRDQFKPYIEHEEKVIDGIKITNVDYATIYVGLLSKGVKSEEAIIKTDKVLANEAKILQQAKEYKVKVDGELPLMARTQEATQGLYTQIRSEIKFNDNDLEKFFNQNKERYATYPSADAYIAILKVEPSQEDKEITRKKAEKLLSKVTVNNFDEIAKKESEDGSASNGGDLGWFGKGQMVPEFEKAAFECKNGEIYPKVVETQFGEHLIYVTDKNETKVKASHIIKKFKISEKTEKAALAEAKEVAAKLSAGEIDFKDLPRDKYTGGELFTNIAETGYIPGVGFNEGLVKDIYKTPLKKIGVLAEGEDIFLFQKIKEVKYKAAVFTDVKDRVQNDYLNQKAAVKLKSIIKD